MHSTSPINTERLTGQNKRLYDYLKQGNSIHVFDPARRKLKIGFINSRVSDLKRHNVVIKKEWITVKGIDGHPVKVKKYSV